MDIQDEAPRNQEEEIRSRNEDKQPGSTTITVRIPYSLKARLYDLSEQSKMTLNAYVATRIYKYVEGELLDPEKANEYEREKKELQDEINQLKRDLEASKKLNQTWEQSYNDLKQEYEQLRDEANSQSEEAVKDEQKFRKELNKANKKVEELKQRPTQKQLDNAKEKIQELKQRPTQSEVDEYVYEIGRLSDLTIEMQYYINRHSGGIFKKPYQFIEDVPINPSDEE